RTTGELPERFTIRKTGIGAGKRTYEVPSMLRAFLIEPCGRASGTNAFDASGADRAPRIWKLETEVDDCAGEALGYAMERLYAAGAREAHYAPVFMKKNRPGYQVEVLCAEPDIEALERVLFEETTTIGVRRVAMERTALAREEAYVDAAGKDVRAKRVILPSGDARLYPEHDDVARIARDEGIAYQEAYRRALRACDGCR
ncbi:MAG: DUF111 family protein, partial [Slackia sp.]|nr:DUF111 family protein [Slackia sp.]